MKLGTGVILIAATLSLSSLSVAQAEETPEQRARTLNDMGKNAYDVGDYAEAAARFNEAYKAYPDRRILFNLAQVYRKQQQYDRALDLYRAMVRSLTPDMPDRQAIVAHIEQHVGQLERLKAEQGVGRSPPQGTQASPAALSPPTVITRIEEQRPWYGNSAGWWLVGGGVVAVGTSVGFFASAASLQDQLGTAKDSEQPGIRSDVQTRRTVGTIAAVVGGVAIAGGITIFIVSPRTVTREIVPIKDLRVSLAPSAIGVSGRF